MRENPLKMLPVGPKEYISFQCTGCGSCCRHVFQSVPVETLDAFRIAKYLRDHDKDISCIDDF